MVLLSTSAQSLGTLVRHDAVWFPTYLLFIQNVLPFYCVLSFDDIFYIYFEVFKLMYHFYLLTTLAFYCRVCPSLAWLPILCLVVLKATETWGKQSRRKKVGIFPRFFLTMSFTYLVAVHKEMCYRIVDCFRLDKLGAPKRNCDFVKKKKSQNAKTFFKHRI